MINKIKLALNNIAHFFNYLKLQIFIYFAITLLILLEDYFFSLCVLSCWVFSLAYKQELIKKQIDGILSILDYQHTINDNLLKQHSFQVKEMMEKLHTKEYQIKKQEKIIN